MGTGLGHGGGKGGGTRLDGLLGLLDSGTNASVRRMAAAQIGELIAAHPAEARPVLRRVRGLLLSHSWDTRVAAGHAIASIAAQTPRFLPTSGVPTIAVKPVIEELGKSQLVKNEEHIPSGQDLSVVSPASSLAMGAKAEDLLAEGSSSSAVTGPMNPNGDAEDTWSSCLQFTSLDLNLVMQSGARLFGSSGNEYESGTVNLQQQRARLKADLGLDDRFTGGQDMLDLTDTDFIAQAPTPAQSSGSLAVDDIVDDMASKNLSARERNRLKREAKKRARYSGAVGRDLESGKRQRVADGSSTIPSTNADPSGSQAVSPGGAVTGNDFSDGQDEYEKSFGRDFCDFQPTCEVLKSALFNVQWEVRHGSAVGLRHILGAHSDSVGRKSGLTEVSLRENQLWLEDICCRLLCVLIMDRFGDFVGDAVVAPVRETAAMAMAAATKSMDDFHVMSLLRLLISLLGSEKAKSSWEVRHAVLLGVRYILAVQASGLNARELIRVGFDPVSAALKDSDDDVRAVAAEALFPIVSTLVACEPGRVPNLVATLWDALLDLDDISASTGSVLRLLKEVSSSQSPDIPSLWWIKADAFDDQDDLETTGAPTSDNVNVDSAPNGAIRTKPPSFREEPLLYLVPRLWAFLRHGSLGVRMAAVSLLNTLFSEEKDMRWFHWICAEAMERLMRNILLESDVKVLAITKKIWSALLNSMSTKPEGRARLVECASPLMSHWIQAASHETRTDAAAFDLARYSKGARSGARKRRSAAAARRAAKARASNGGISGSSIFGLSSDESSSSPSVEGPFDGVAMQQSVSDAIGMLVSVWPDTDETVVTLLLQTLRNPFATARRVGCDVARCWAVHGGSKAAISPRVLQALVLEMEGRSDCQYGEIGVISAGFFADTISLLDAVGDALASVVDVHSILGNCHDGKRAVGERDYSSAALTARSLHPYVQDAVAAKWSLWETHSTSAKLPKRKADLVHALRQRVLTSLGYMSGRNEDLAVALAAGASAALVAAESFQLPPKVGPYIKALTASTRKSKNPHTQEVSGECLALLARRLAIRGTAKPLQLLMKNLTKHLTAEPLRTATDDTALPKGDANPGTTRRRGKSAVSATTAKAISDAKGIDVSTSLDHVEVARRGASLTFCAFCRLFGSALFEMLPWMWNTIRSGCDEATRSASERVDGLTILRTTVGHVVESVHGQVASLIPSVIQRCADEEEIVRDLAVECLADVVAAIPGAGMRDVIHQLLPLLSGVASGAVSETATVTRRGASRALRAVVDRLGSSLIPYAAFLIVPVMMRMVDEDTVVRDASSGIFGVLVRLMPLESGAPDDPEMSLSMSKEREEARQFLGQLLGSHPRTHYEMPVAIGDGVTLRKYQQECLDWLAFLNRYGLHGALCDDMGLGKTLMTLCIMAGTRYTTPGVPVGIAGPASTVSCPSLVVCPSTIAAHWVQECKRFFPEALDPVILYVGSPRVRSRIRSSVAFESAALVVTSYDVLSNDLQYFSSVRWNYLSLDEGHVIKNPKTRVARAVRTLSPQHRLVLTGTPIQNSVLELWSLFDFLMPGFLGSEQSFKETYAKPILASRGSECTERDQEKGLLATEALHRQVLPFVLRRLKDDVLSELPPKIMQDYYCSMTPLQVELYEDFSRDVKEKGVGAVADGGQDSAAGGSAGSGGAHVFKVLSYLRRLCSHPKLVLSKDHPEYDRVTRDLAGRGESIDSISSSAKMIGLRNILQECGIGDVNSGGRETGGHRALIFGQLKQMLDLVETDLFRAHMPNVTYLRLDGSVESTKRQGIVTRFNADPTIDCLLLTTSVGGLGLNLVGADTVIFLEHDWNPTKDLQAMDRAHRMGQKKTVNVYRLITRGTLEEKIMGIQKFKTHIANTVVNRDNSSLQSMNTETLLSLFNVEGDGESDAAKDASTSREGKGMKAALAGLGELWEETQYEDEYNMGDFLSGLQSANRQA